MSLEERLVETAGVPAAAGASVLNEQATPSHMMNTYRPPAQVFVRGRGCYLYDADGRRYLDFITGIGVNALGYAHPRLLRVMRREAGRAIPGSIRARRRYGIRNRDTIAQLRARSSTRFLHRSARPLSRLRTEADAARGTRRNW